MIVFVKTKFGTERLALRLRKEGHDVEAIHGDLRQAKRERVIREFRAGKSRVLVATDVAARGLDIPHIECVVNYDLPQCPEDYIHRIGRTGRAGAQGFAVSLVTGQDGGKWRGISKLMSTNGAQADVKIENRVGKPAEYKENVEAKAAAGMVDVEVAVDGARRDRGEFRDRGERKPFGERRSFDRGDRQDRGERSARPFGDRPERPAFGDRKPFGDRPSRSFGDRPARPFGDRPERPAFGDRKPFGDRPSRSFGDRPARPFGDRPERPAFGDRKPFGDRPSRPYGDRPSFGARKPFGDRQGRAPFVDALVEDTPWKRPQSRSNFAPRAPRRESVETETEK